MCCFYNTKGKIHPFDALALDYDDEFTNRLLGRWLRGKVWVYLARSFDRGEHVLDLGCGTGEDSIWLARRGVCTTAIDASQKMIELARYKVEKAGVKEFVNLFHMDFSDISKMTTAESPFNENQFDGVFSNFGALNCIPERRAIARQLASVLKPGGIAVFVLMSPYCPWEIGWHILHGQYNNAFRRMQKENSAHLGHGESLSVWYPSPIKLQKEFEPYFKIIALRGIGVLLPPSYLNHLVERWSHIFRVINRWDDFIGRYFPGTWLNDHYLMILKRT